MLISRTRMEASLESLIGQPMVDLGYSLVRIRIDNAGKGNIVQIMLERQDKAHISIDNCREASIRISKLLEENEITSLGEYTLEVSSPGIERPLTRKEDFSTYIGSEIRLSTIAPVNGRKRHMCMLHSTGDEEIQVVPMDSAAESAEITVRLDNISEAYLLNKLPMGKNKSHNKSKKPK